MKIHPIFYFLLGVVLTVSVAAASSEIITFKPAKPVSVTVYDGTHPKGFVLEMTKNGYIIKSTVHSSNGVMVVMEKY